MRNPKICNSLPHLYGDIPDISDLDDLRVISLATLDGAFVDFGGIVSGDVEAQGF